MKRSWRIREWSSPKRESWSGAGESGSGALPNENHGAELENQGVELSQTRIMERSWRIREWSSPRRGVKGNHEFCRANAFFKYMRSVEANRSGTHRNDRLSFKNSAFFRKGEVGDWKAHMTPEMARRLDDIVEEKLRGSGLSMIAHAQP